MTQRYKEKHRQQFHFSPEEKWMNDPNGMVFFNNEYHLFYQYHPFGTTWGPIHWGHAVSKDLIHWEQLPIALYPDEHGAIFSGSAVVDWNNTSGLFQNGPGLVAIYTSADNYPNSDRPRQRQSLAYSTDNGRTWTKYEGNPVLSDVNITDYRDPKVFWHAVTNKWVMVLATGQSATIYTSPNLKDWEFASEFGNNAGSHDGVWECPDLFQLPVDGDENIQKWVLFVSIGDNHDFKEGSRTQYFIGDFDGTTFVNENTDETILWMDHGRDNYAGVSWSDIPAEDGRRIYIGWMSNWRYANQVPTEEWRSAMTLPRVLSLASNEAGVRLIQKVAAEIETIRKSSEVYQDLTVEANQPAIFNMFSPLMEVSIQLENQTSNSFGIVFQNSEDVKTVVRYDAEKEMLLVDRTKAGDNSFSESFPAVQEAYVKLENLQIIIDTSSIEVFANDGKVAFTSLIFPNQPYEKIVIFSNEGNIRVSSLKLTELDSIWGK
ncbi:glycoside hydrolase family 32 protein [Bacillus sp. ISL-40]|uniref:glycoside hydrolase family 32 protein n=1 Tax=unclassified Bacillus (in: firmicutes) TaxID=185979 RepID=UPI001BEA408B|nr:MULTISPECIES: glycoside hydrolase family 32 protein [unclassified Bacillus (in: firmicutes)]MBT2697451.1 glycoside hydrolase family 32 protein [Bacillus sp. ISL-40]MBT2720999.1 glycoside hydrolase family 32 protein [Bacillus sp. ISL-46]MBT2741733.1 glycoside hydrolase family 32 protein [Bacillus sp. ISL-77]